MTSVDEKVLVRFALDLVMLQRVGGWLFSGR